MPKYAANTVWLLLIDKTSFNSVAIFSFLPIAISAKPVCDREREREQQWGTGTYSSDICPFSIPLNSCFCAGGHVVAGFSEKRLNIHFTPSER